jgi:hypothetical protein
MDNKAVVTVDMDVIHGIWDEKGDSWDICRMARGDHIEQL